MFKEYNVFTGENFLTDNTLWAGILSDGDPPILPHFRDSHNMLMQFFQKLLVNCLTTEYPFCHNNALDIKEMTLFQQQ